MQPVVQVNGFGLTRQQMICILASKLIIGRTNLVLRMRRLNKALRATV
jgi:hypothetical protein